MAALLAGSPSNDTSARYCARSAALRPQQLRSDHCCCDGALLLARWREQAQARLDCFLASVLLNASSHFSEFRVLLPDSLHLHIKQTLEPTVVILQT